jgi:hypothetical protein
MSDRPPVLQPRRRFPWPRYLFGFALIAVLAVLPFVISIASSEYAAGQGCHVDEGSIHPCVIAGQDYGDLFYTLGMLGWLGLASVPLGLLVGGILLVVMLVHAAVWSRRRRALP